MKKLVSLLGLLLCAACSTPEYISPGITAQEKAISQSMIALEEYPQKQEASYAENKVRARAIFEKLKIAGAPVCRFTSEQKYNSCSFMTLQFKNDDTVNAYAHGSNNIVIYSGLMAYANSDDELALVIGHEMGHHLADHINEDQKHAAVGSVVGAILLGALGALSGDANLAGEMANLGATAGGQAGALSFSKEQEQEADYIGSYLVAKAGYDVKKGSRFFAKMYKLNPRTGSKDPAKSALFDTHPTDDERHATLLKISKEVEKKKASDQVLLPFKGSRKQ